MSNSPLESNSKFGIAIQENHPCQFAAVGLMLIFNIVMLVLINRSKRSSPQLQHGCAVPWVTRRNAYWTLIATQISLAVWLDAHYEISPALLPLKQYAFGFSLGLLDLHFSSTSGVPLKVVAGAAMWCSTIYLRQAGIDAYFGGDGVPPVVVRSVGARTLAVEALRFVVSLPIVGILSDLIFSPMHRLAHHPRIYQGHHKEHHEYTNKLTALVLYHGALLDDFLMPLTTVVGYVLYAMLLGLVGLEHEAYSSVSGYLMVFNTLLSHAHDARCARLMAPLPDSLNFVSYHYVHHLSPTNNYGLTEPSDLIWDKLLGVSTIKKLTDFEPSGARPSTKVE